MEDASFLGAQEHPKWCAKSVTCTFVSQQRKSASWSLTQSKISFHEGHGMTWHDTQPQDLIRVGAKLCRTVALQDPSFPGPHYDTNLSLYQMQYINAFQVGFFPFRLLISLLFWQIWEHFVLLPEHCPMICEWRISFRIVHLCCIMLPWGNAKIFWWGGGWGVVK